MPPNPSKIMAPIQLQMQSTPIKTRPKNTKDLYFKERNGGQNRSTTAGRISPKKKSSQNVCKPSERASPATDKVKVVTGNEKGRSPSLKQGQGYNGRKSISPDISYAGAKFSEAPTPDHLPMPPSHWLTSFSQGRARVNGASCSSIQQGMNPSNGLSAFEDMAKDLKMMLKVEC